MNGHWFCSHCDDVVNLHPPLGRWDVRHGVKCPVCHQSTTDWIHDASEHLALTQPPRLKPISPVTAAKLFEQMKQAIK